MYAQSFWFFFINFHELLKETLSHIFSHETDDPKRADQFCKTSILECLIEFRIIPKNNWHLAIWQNWCFGQFYYSRIGQFDTSQFDKIELVFWSILIIQEWTNLRTGNLEKIVFWSIWSFRNWNFAKILSFLLCQFLLWEIIW